jgi:hypothetical protein
MEGAVMYFTFYGVAIPWWLALIVIILGILGFIGRWKYGRFISRDAMSEYRRREDEWTKRW